MKFLLAKVMKTWEEVIYPVIILSLLAILIVGIIAFSIWFDKVRFIY